MLIYLIQDCVRVILYNKDRDTICVVYLVVSPSIRRELVVVLSIYLKYELPLSIVWGCPIFKYPPLTA